LEFTIGAFSFQSEQKTELNIWKESTEGAISLFKALNAVASEQKRRACVVKLCGGGITAVSQTDASSVVALQGASYSDILAPYVI
jgi:hypothetical protein